MLYKFWYFFFKRLILRLIGFIVLIDEKQNENRRLSLYYSIGREIDKNVVVDNIIFDCSYISPFRKATTFLEKESELS